MEYSFEPKPYTEPWIDLFRQRVHTLGTRDSALAVAQAQEVAALLQRHGYQSKIVTMSTTGDKVLDRPVGEIGGKGVFVKELDQALLEGQIDFAVHSMKDLPAELPRGLEILGCSPREDPRDVLVLPKGQTKWDPRQPVGCGSQRRAVQLRYRYPNINIVPIRGNVLTRIQMLDQGKYGSLILAAAGLHRLGLEDRINHYFSTDEILPAVGQGTLAVVWRRDPFITPLASCFSTPALCLAQAERAFLRAMGGGCGSATTAYARFRPDGLVAMEAFHCNPDGSRPRRSRAVGFPYEHEHMVEKLVKELK